MTHFLRVVSEFSCYILLHAIILICSMTNLFFSIGNMIALDRKLKAIYHSRKNGYKRQLSQMNIPFKKRKLYDHRSVSNSEDGMNQDASGPRNREGFYLNYLLIFHYDFVFPMN